MTDDRAKTARLEVSRRVVLAELLSQHADLRTMIERCERMAEELDCGAVEPTVLTREVARLRVAFDVHNQYEERLLRPLLADTGAFAEVRLDRMISDHVDEHRLMRHGLAAQLLDELRTTLARMRDHLAAEERYFLSAQILRDDVMVIEGTG